MCLDIYFFRHKKYILGEFNLTYRSNSIHENTSIFPGDVKRFSNTARHRAIKYLEKNLAKINDPYEVKMRTVQF